MCLSYSTSPFSYYLVSVIYSCVVTTSQCLAYNNDDLLFLLILWMVWAVLILCERPCGCIRLADWLGLGSVRSLAEASHLSSPLRGSKRAKIEVTRSFETYLVSHVESCLWPRFLGNSKDQPSLGRNGGGGITLPPDGRSGKISLQKGCRIGVTV